MSASEQATQYTNVRSRLTRDEHSILVQKAADCGITLSEYLRACALGRRTRNVSTSRMLDALVMLGHEQRRIGELVTRLGDAQMLSVAERAVLVAQIEAAQQAVIDAIRGLDDAGKGTDQRA
ncbi:plasmid mobilization protein [Paraburkholderia sp. BR10882]|uniref:plasmid mobilization protein n=1 Tax=unclassified Paraburkholderia TaxID=2615204 RepID=UPI0034CD47D2